MKISLRIIIIAVTASAVLSSCSKYSKMLKSINLDEKLEYAIKLYDKKQYYKALPIFEELITMYRGTKKAERTYYYYAYTNYKLEDYETAAFDFGNFSRSFPYSEYAEECAYMQAYCYYLSSPLYSLDQANTYKAINQFQLFIDQYPSSSRIASCNELIDKLRFKLERKSFESAELYFHMEDFKAAVTAFRNVIKEFPATIFREQTLFMIFKSEFFLAENSIESKKSERYNNALISFGEFTNAYPESKYMKEAQGYADNCRKKIEKISMIN